VADRSARPLCEERGWPRMLRGAMGRYIAGYRHPPGRLLRTALGVLLLWLLAACALLGPDYAQLPVEQPGLSALPAGAPPALVAASDAVRIAQAATGVGQQPAGVGRRLNEASGRTVWVVLFVTNRDQRPCGPAPLPGQESGVCVTVFAGGVIDDQTGAVDHTFEMGRQMWPEE
jgi:hypothetical protein